MQPRKTDMIMRIRSIIIFKDAVIARGKAEDRKPGRGRGLTPFVRERNEELWVRQGRNGIQAVAERVVH
jgi:hypothetical protein